MFQTTFIKWKEPKEYIESKLKTNLSDKTVWQKLQGPFLIFILLSASLLFQYYLGASKPDSKALNMWSAFAVIFSGSAFCALFLFISYRYGHRIFSADVKIQDKQIIKSHPLQSFYDYKDIKNFSFDNFSIKGFSCFELVLELENEPEIVKIGLNRKDIKDEIKRILIGQGLIYKE